MASRGREVWVVGAGGHAKVVIATLRADGFAPHAILDDDPGKADAAILGVPVHGPLPDAGCWPEDGRGAVIGIGDNGARRRIARRFPAAPWTATVHPSAVVDRSVSIRPGAVVFAGAVVQPDTAIGAHAILNTGATVDHDSEIGDFCHVAPGCSLAGGVFLGEGALLGVGVCVLPGRRIGAWSVVGAGAVVTRDVPDGAKVAGVPARRLARAPGTG